MTTAQTLQRSTIEGFEALSVVARDVGDVEWNGPCIRPPTTGAVDKSTSTEGTSAAIIEVRESMKGGRAIR
jgi:hypothetical protein